MAAAESSHAQRVLSSLNQQRAVGKFCDAVLNLGDGVLYLAHRNVLACFSELLELSGTEGAPCTEFRLQSCPGDGLELLLSFIYTGELKLKEDSLPKVQQAAASLCVPEALALCQQFRRPPVEPAPAKRRRGRPRKPPLGGDKEENPPPAPAGVSAAAAAAPATTTRSGRVVKGPRRLVTADESATSDCKRSALDPEEGEPCDDAEESLAAEQPAAESQVAELQMDPHDRGMSPVTGETEGEEEDASDLDRDEEYLPAGEHSPTATAPKAPSKTNRSTDAAEKESNKDSVQCPICHKSFKSKYYLKVHNRRHTGERPFGCLKCGKRYFRKENLFFHQGQDCTRVLTYTCPTCSSNFDTKEELRVHVVTHTGEMPHKCSTCSEQFMYKKNLTMHMMKVHGHPKPHTCPQCPKTFLTRTELRVHEAAKHRGEKPFVCEECGHRASSRNGLQMHIKAIHRNERPFVCNICGHAFSQKNNLNLHLRVHSGERPYQCHLCGKTFRTQASLDKHHRTHTGERPYSCDVCEQRFTEKGALLRHKASKHQEGRPHCCQICNKTFKAKEQLRVHLRRHKGMRKFECIDCGYKFTRQAHLRRHILIHKRTENYNPRQRKLRNIIVQEVEGSPDKGEAPNFAEAQQISDYAPESPLTSEPTTPRPDSPPGLDAGSVVRVVVEPGDTATEVATNRNVEHGEEAGGFSESEALRRSQLVGEEYESAADMGGDC
ncbi:telomere zinc finger-associated protein [Kryptolebias marmoratus]|uniref:Zinc finger and BTB domain containing 48 n=1 Tax=Kryptolebias marmoratus TaxID=37003 RepID=A0A3Q2ZJL6_KRYMA|nr:telomere zinc finger-associated protein [Kryptolebias marmoratus]XP_017274630.1 telomere zinc finger-associated protein [Kryptolebias marmoratus]